MADLYGLNRMVTLKIKSRSQNLIIFSTLPTMNLFKSGQNPSASSEDNAHKRLIYTFFISCTVTLKIRSRSPKSNQLFLRGSHVNFDFLV